MTQDKERIDFLDDLIVDEYARDPEQLAAFLNVVLEQEGLSVFLSVLGMIVSKGPGVKTIAAATGLKKARIKKAFSKKGNPRLTTLLPVLKALGLRIEITPLPDADPS